MEIYDRNIAEEWYQYGLKTGDDFFMRFMMHWIGFNWLYNQIPCRDERQKIKKFYEQNRKTFDKVDPFNMPEIDVFLNGAVFDMTKGEPRTVDYQNLKKYSAEALLLTLYQVRCNLFHGSKSLRVERDKELVRASADILEKYMKVLVEDISVKN